MNVREKSFGANSTKARSHAIIKIIERTAPAHAAESLHEVNVIDYNVIILFFTKLRGWSIFIFIFVLFLCPFFSICLNFSQSMGHVLKLLQKDNS